MGLPIFYAKVYACFSMQIWFQNVYPSKIIRNAEAAQKEQ